MKTRILILITTLCISVSAATAAEKSKALVQLDSARVAVEALAGRIGDNKEAAADLELAKSAIRKGAEVSEKGSPDVRIRRNEAGIRTGDQKLR